SRTYPGGDLSDAVEAWLVVCLFGARRSFARTGWSVSPKCHGGPAEADSAAVHQTGLVDLLSVDEGPIGRTLVHEDGLVPVETDLDVVPGDSVVDQAQIAVGSTSEQRDRGRQLEGLLHPVAGDTALGGCTAGGDQQPGTPRLLTAVGLAGVTDRPADLSVLVDHAASNDTGSDPETAGLEPLIGPELDTDRTDEGVTLFGRVVARQLRQLLTEAVCVNLQALLVVGREFHDEVVRDQGAALGDDRRALVHLSLDCARHLDWLELRLEGHRQGAFDHALKPALEALEHSHEVPPFVLHFVCVNDRNRARVLPVSVAPREPLPSRLVG